MVFQVMAGASFLSFCLMVRLKLSQAIENLSTLFGFGSSVQCTVVGKLKLVDDISLHFSQAF